eukprot:1180589-Prorocentrum_minimum.AAC.2
MLSTRRVGLKPVRMVKGSTTAITADTQTSGGSAVSNDEVAARIALVNNTREDLAFYSTVQFYSTARVILRPTTATRIRMLSLCAAPSVRVWPCVHAPLLSECPRCLQPLASAYGLTAVLPHCPQPLTPAASSRICFQEERYSGETHAGIQLMNSPPQLMNLPLTLCICFQEESYSGETHA